VSSEDSEILGLSKKYGADIVVRPKKYARDNSAMEPVIKDALSQLMKKNIKFDILILLQPTSPLRDSGDIDKAFRIFFDKKATALISGYQPEKSPLKTFKIKKNGYLEGLISEKAPFMNRQSLSATFYPNGAIYIIGVSSFMKFGKLFTPKTIPFLMPIEKSIDIDTKADIKKINLVIKNRNANEKDKQNLLTNLCF
jgi:N-acylneuraminate cytidylyltransferase